MAQIEDKNKNQGLEEEDVVRINITSILDDMYVAFLKFWFYFLLIILIFAGAAYAKVRLTHVPTYEAYATFTVVSGSSEFYTSADYYNTIVTKGVSETLTYLLDSNVLKKMITEDLGLSSLDATISTSTMADTNIVTLSVVAEDGQRAYEILWSALRCLPTISNHVMGNLTLDLMDQSGVPVNTNNWVSPRRNALKGAIIGMLVCLVIMLLYALTRKTVRNEEDLKKLLNTPTLASVPYAVIKRRRSKKAKDMLFLMDHTGIPPYFQEAIRNMRSRVVRYAKKNRTSVILVSSALQGEGKTTISCNLAISLFRQGYKVILVDGDLRNPSICKTLGMDDQTSGLYEVLKGESPAEDVMIPYVRSDSKDRKQHTHLMILPGSATIAEHPTGLIHSQRAKDLFDKLRTEADFVIIDTPPSAILSDASYYAPYADGAIFVIRQDYASEANIHEGVEMLAETRLKILGCVLNYAMAGEPGKGYGHSYGYGRYGYGRYGKYGSRYGYGKYGKGYGYGYGVSGSGSHEYGYGYGGKGRTDEDYEKENSDGENFADE